MLAPAITNALTIDVEDYFQVSAFAPYIARSDWDRVSAASSATCSASWRCWPSGRSRATFFTLGWIAERYPPWCATSSPAGMNWPATAMATNGPATWTEKAFREDVTRAKSVLEDIGGVAVKGYRAPSFSIGKGNLWALETLRAPGTATAPASTRSRTTTTACPMPRALPPDRHGLLEVPVTTLRLFNRNLPSSGGGYFRLLPYGVALDAAACEPGRARAGDLLLPPLGDRPGQPRIAGIDAKTRFRHYVNIDRNEGKLARCSMTSAGAGWMTFFSTKARPRDTCTRQRRLIAVSLRPLCSTSCDSP
jgi:polysaccharide deacetylase family protein (PEP-CTERM system associated)